jgi:hypothetical protein
MPLRRRAPVFCAFVCLGVGRDQEQCTERGGRGDDHEGESDRGGARRCTGAIRPTTATSSRTVVRANDRECEVRDAGLTDRVQALVGRGWLDMLILALPDSGKMPASGL